MRVRQEPVSLSLASSRMVATDSSRARSMKAHVFTTRQSASSGRAASGMPASASMPSISSESTWFFGQPSVVRWTFIGESLGAPVVGELQRDPEVFLLEERDDPLQIVAVLARDAHVVLLDRGLHLDLRVLDEPHDLLGLLDRNALLERDLLPERAPRGLLDRAVGERLERHAALVQPGLEDVHHRLELHVVGDDDDDVGLVERHLVLRALEVVARLDLAPGLIQRLCYFLPFYL